MRGGGFAAIVFSKKKRKKTRHNSGAGAAAGGQHMGVGRRVRCYFIIKNKKIKISTLTNSGAGAAPGGQHLGVGRGPQAARASRCLPGARADRHRAAACCGPRRASLGIDVADAGGCESAAGAGRRGCGRGNNMTIRRCFLNRAGRRGCGRGNNMTLLLVAVSCMPFHPPRSLPLP